METGAAARAPRHIYLRATAVAAALEGERQEEEPYDGESPHRPTPPHANAEVACFQPLCTQTHALFL